MTDAQRAIQTGHIPGGIASPDALEEQSREPLAVVGGVDTHLDFHVAAAVNALGALLGVAVFESTARGYAQLLGWLQQWGPLAAVGVEGTGSYGAGLARHLNRHGVPVQEVIRPDRADRRRRGKTDGFDAEAAARTVLAGRAHQAKINTGPVEALRLLKIQYDSAVKQRTATLNQMHQIRLTAPEPLREQLAGLTKDTLPARCARFRINPTDLTDPARAVTAAAKRALRGLARRVLALSAEITDLDQAIDDLVTRTAPRTKAAFGAGTQTTAQLLITIGEHPDRFRTEAAFAALCGVNPIPASSGKTSRHRLNRGGDRHANSALHMIVLNRLAHHQPTRTYIATRSRDHKSDAHLRRKLKRYLARELFTLLRADLQALNAPPIAA